MSEASFSIMRALFEAGATRRVERAHEARYGNGHVIGFLSENAQRWMRSG